VLQPCAQTGHLLLLKATCCPSFCLSQIVELVPGGREVKVTEANKHEYVNLIARHRMTTSIKAQIQVCR
jgi:hypothetical protein